MSSVVYGAAENAVALKQTLDSGGYTCVLSDGADIATSKERGVLPLVKFINSGKDFRGYYAADKVVGKAAALLYAYMGVTELFAHIMSDRATEVLSKYGIAYRYGITVPRIINRKGDGDCPMETATANVEEPSEALAVVTEKLKSMNLL